MGAFFAPAESSWGYFHLFSEIFKQHGVTVDLYRLSLGILDRPGTDAR
jgi:hypothetical protein